MSSELEKKVLNGGFIWNMTSLLCCHIVVGAYLLMSNAIAVDNGLNSYFFGLVCLAFGAIFYLTEKKNTDSIKCWLISSAFISASWAFVGLVSFYSWGCFDNAEKIWIVGFMAMMIGWYANNVILAISLPTILVSYIWLAIYTMDITGYTFAVIALSSAKFILLAAIFQTSIGKQFRVEKEQYKEKIDKIHKLESAVYKDELTGILNRKGFNRGIDYAIKIAKSKGIAISLLMVDVDFFKKYNDSLGHPAGDTCLIKLARTILKECSRETDIVARIGGEEFAVILIDCDKRQTKIVADRIQAAIKKHGIPHPKSVVSDLVTVSIGIAQYEGEGEECLYQNADEALYKAKYLGKNRSYIHCNSDCICGNYNNS